MQTPLAFLLHGTEMQRAFVASQMWFLGCHVALFGYFARDLWQALFSWRERTRRVTLHLVHDALIALVAECQSEFIARWWVYFAQIPDMGAAELSWWMSLYVRGGLIALGLLTVSWAYRRLVRATGVL